MWRIVDHTNGRISAALEKHWSGPVANDALECPHDFGEAMDIAHELTYLGFQWHKDFDLRPARAAALSSVV
jgi:hypothetical protein